MVAMEVCLPSLKTRKMRNSWGQTKSMSSWSQLGWYCRGFRSDQAPESSDDSWCFTALAGSVCNSENVIDGRGFKRIWHNNEASMCFSMSLCAQLVWDELSELRKLLARKALRIRLGFGFEWAATPGDHPGRANQNHPPTKLTFSQGLHTEKENAYFTHSIDLI